jgi:hypothetical protein
LYHVEPFNCDEIAELVDFRPDQDGGLWLATFVLCRSLLAPAVRFLAGSCSLITSLVCRTGILIPPLALELELWSSSERYLPKKIPRS